MNQLPSRPQTVVTDYPQPPLINAFGHSEMDAIYKEFVQGVRDKYEKTTGEIEAIWKGYGDELLKAFSVRFSLAVAAAVILLIYSVAITILYLCA
jgi:hypothetical protein